MGRLLRLPHDIGIATVSEVSFPTLAERMRDRWGKSCSLTGAHRSLVSEIRLELTTQVGSQRINIYPVIFTNGELICDFIVRRKCCVHPQKLAALNWIVSNRESLPPPH
jgi:hypothetical protein